LLTVSLFITNQIHTYIRQYIFAFVLPYIFKLAEICLRKYNRKLQGILTNKRPQFVILMKCISF